MADDKPHGSFGIAGQADFNLLQGIYSDAGRWLHDEKGISDQ